jgi:pimeloyl-ACP methyl ester carboxylesterase
MPKMLVNSINFHYWRVGAGPDMVMLHGLTGNLASWHFTALPALRHAYRITTYDLRGHGRSDMPPTGYTTRDMAEDLRGIMDALDIERADLVGHSLGADIALHFAVLYPERVGKIVAIEAGLAALVHLRKDVRWPGWAAWARGLEKYGDIKVPPDKWNDIDYMLRESLKVPVIFGPGRGLPRKSERILKLLDTTSLVQDYENTAGLSLDALAQIRHPVLLVYGDESHYLGTYDALRDVLPNCATGLIAGSEHFAVVEQPAQLLDYMQGFLQYERPADLKREIAT